MWWQLETFVVPSSDVCDSGYIQRPVDGGGGAVACVPCPPGQYEFGHFICLSAPSLNYIPGYGSNESAMIECPPRKRYQRLTIDVDDVIMELNRGGSALEDCSCAPDSVDEGWLNGYQAAPYRFPLIAGNVSVGRRVCLPCPEGATCRGGLLPPVARPGYAQLGRNGTSFIRCKNYKYCEAGNFKEDLCDCSGGVIHVQPLTLSDGALGQIQDAVSTQCFGGRHSDLC